jgi:hypothetical protein
MWSSTDGKIIVFYFEQDSACYIITALEKNEIAPLCCHFITRNHSKRLQTVCVRVLSCKWLMVVFLQHTNGRVTRSNNGQIVVFNVLPILRV